MDAPTAFAETMNPERAQMLLEVAKEEAELPPVLIKIEDSPPPPVTGANGAPMGDWTLRLLKRSESSMPGENPILPSIESAADVKTQPLPFQFQAPAMAQFGPAAALPKRPNNQHTKLGKKKQKKPQKNLSIPPGVSFTIPALDPPPVPDAHTRHLEGMLDCQPFRLELRTPKNLDSNGTGDIHELMISGVGLSHHLIVSRLPKIPVFEIVPAAHDNATPGNGLYHSMHGELLEDIWSSLTSVDKYSYAHQLRGIVTAMRKPNTSGRPVSLGSAVCGPYSLLLDRHSDHTYFGVRNHLDISEFVAFLLTSFCRTVPKIVAHSLVSKLRVNTKLTLTHSQLCPKNIIVSGGKIVAIIGWDFAGWYPIWWEYVKFFEAKTRDENDDWYDYANEIFVEQSLSELAIYQGVARCQRR